MNRSVKIILIAAAALVVLGAILCASAFLGNGKSFDGFGSADYVTNTYDIDESFRNISIESETEDIIFTRSEDGKCRVIFYEHEKEPHSADVQGDTLTIRVKDDRKWFEFFSLGGGPKMTICLPAREYAALSVKESTGNIELPEDFAFDSIEISASTGDVDCRASVRGTARIGLSTGDIRISGVTAGELALTVSTGKVEIENAACSGDLSVKVSTGRSALSGVTCRNFYSEGSTGKITMTDLIADGEISVKRDTGDVKLDRCDAAELTIETTTGDVRGVLLSDKVFIVRSDTGHIDVPKTVTGGKCEITTDTGDIVFSAE